MSQQLNYPSQVSIGNTLSQPEFSPDEGFRAAPLIQDLESFAMTPTGQQQDLDFLKEPFNEDWPEALQNRWEEHHIYQNRTTPAAASERTLRDVDAERASAAQASDPLRQAEVATKQVDAVQKQQILQNQFVSESRNLQLLQELEDLGDSKYTPRVVTRILGDYLPMNTQSRQVMNRVNQINAYAKTLASQRAGTRTVSGRGGDTLSALAQAEGQIDPAAELGPQIKALRSVSQARLDTLRASMESAGIPMPTLPEQKKEPTPQQRMISEASVKRGDGSAVTLPNGQPVIYANGNYLVATPSGNFRPATEAEIADIERLRQ
jgi:hypothetical protein